MRFQPKALGVLGALLSELTLGGCFAPQAGAPVSRHSQRTDRATGQIGRSNLDVAIESERHLTAHEVLLVAHDISARIAPFSLHECRVGVPDGGTGVTQRLVIGDTLLSSYQRLRTSDAGASTVSVFVTRRAGLVTRVQITMADGALSQSDYAWARVGNTVAILQSPDFEDTNPLGFRDVTIVDGDIVTRLHKSGDGGWTTSRVLAPGHLQ